MAEASNGAGRPLERQAHPRAAGRRGKLPFPKGRYLGPEEVEAVRAVLGEDDRRGDLLIEYLHRLQDRFGCLHAGHLQALGEELRLPMAAVYETASFYAHFDIVPDGAMPPAPVTVRVCDGLPCMMAGAESLASAVQAGSGTDVRVVRAPCMGRCACAPAVEVGHRHLDKADPETVVATAVAGELEPVLPDYRTLDQYRADGGYRLLAECQSGARQAESVIAALSDASLRGLGGAGFPAGRKWSIVRGQPGERLVAINADEGEPGTFKDRYILETDPHRFLEGMLIAACAVGAGDCYIYLRDEYPAAREILLREIDALEAAGLTGGHRVVLRRGAGAYICGEESAMLESLEGKRGLPRHKPPFAAEVGLFDKPTLTHNVETLYWIRDILENGADWFAGHGRRERTGLRLFSVSGRVADPGVKRAPAGISARELIDEYCGGMAPGHRLKAYLPGGASGGILPADMADLPLDFGTLEDHGCFIGSAAVIVLSQQDRIPDAVLNLMRFFEDESCGQCTPCRVGTEKTVRLLADGRYDRALLADLSDVMRSASICGLGQAAPNPLDCLFRYFPEEIS